MVPLCTLIVCLIFVQPSMGHMAPIRAGLGYVRAGLHSSGGWRVNSEFEFVCLWLEAAVLEPDSR